MLHLNFGMLLVCADVLYYVYKPVLKNKTMFFSQKKIILLSIKGHFPLFLLSRPIFQVAVLG